MDTKWFSHSIVFTACIAMLHGCGGNDDDDNGTTPPNKLSCTEAAERLAKAGSSDWDNLRILTSEEVASTETTPTHCHVVAAANERVSEVDGQSYAIKVRMRLPENWNGRLFMNGGGGSNGTLGEGLGDFGNKQEGTALAEGYAVVVTDSGHDNAINTNPDASGASAFGLDPQARIDFGYHSYYVATRVGKSMVNTLYRKPAEKSYFVGCSEGGREAMMMAQRFPTEYDGIVAGAPAMRLPRSAAYAPFLLQTFGELATAQGNVDDQGMPLINKTYTDQDLGLISQAVKNACDATDGIADGMVNNLAACTTESVMAELQASVCTAEKSETCLTPQQIDAWATAMAGPRTSSGQQITQGHPWDPGIGGRNGDAWHTGFRSWWLGSYDSPVNNAIKVTLSTPQHAMVWTTPPTPLTASQYVPFELNFDIDQTEYLVTTTTGTYTESSASFGKADSPDLDAFRNHGGKLLVYHGAADSALSLNDTIEWYEQVRERYQGNESEFARLFPVPGMDHCTGGPSTDKFNAFGALVNWVENGEAPDSIMAESTSPGFFDGKQVTRPLCPYPSFAQYRGQGDPNDAANFVCSTS